MGLKEVANNYLAFIILFVFGFIIFWYAFVTLNYFVVFLSLMLLVICLTKIEVLCVAAGKYKSQGNINHGSKADAHELKRVLRVIDDLLGELPKEKIDRFVRSKDYEHYKSAMEKYLK